MKSSQLLHLKELSKPETHLVGVDDSSEEGFAGVAAHPSVVEMCHSDVSADWTVDHGLLGLSHIRDLQARISHLLLSVVVRFINFSRRQSYRLRCATATQRDDFLYPGSRNNLLWLELLGW